MSLPDGHYKLSSDSVAAPGGEKHKAFWVECEVAATSSTSSTTSTTIAGARTLSTISTTAPAEVLGEQLTTSTSAGPGTTVAVKPAEVLAAEAQAAAQETLPFTGEWFRSVAGMALALLALGALILATVRRARLNQQ